MRIFFLTALTMIAFAANSVLNRMAIVDGGMDAVSFGLVRLGAGALALSLMVGLCGKGFAFGGARRVLGTSSLMLYIFGFSLAYVALDAGLGALVLFGMVQITMFAWAVLMRETLPKTRWAGAALAFGGLVFLLWPNEGFVLSGGHVFSMVLAGIGWGIYSLVGRTEVDPLQATAMNFSIAAPIAIIVAQVLPLDIEWPALDGGFALAALSGVVTSGLGYALWYQILPTLGATRAAVAQLTVPVIALSGGIALLGEALSMQFVISAVLVLGGVALSVMPIRKP